MSPLLRRCSLILSACCLTAACSSLTVKPPYCEPPPLPMSSVSACPIPEDLPDGAMGTLYLAHLQNLQLWKECIRKFNHLVELVRYRDQVCKDLQNRLENESKKWWQ